ncbi:uncharacterized protein si:ch211-168f7.5 [Osmerus mordax]|uniref:uncharacterized protein si:ch211-168f7.5 n=1 Tax=Osmerus mordax TaxID=8014 RepID=UPI00350F41AE
MAGRRSCVNSLWSGTERVRISERLKATLAGIFELDLLRGKHLEMVDAALIDKDTTNWTGIDQQGPNLESAASDGSATSRRQQVPSPSEVVSPAQSTTLDSGGNSGEGPVHSRGSEGNSRWSTLSWDTPSDMLSPPTPEPDSGGHLDFDSRPSSGFYSVSGSSLSDSCYSVSSEAAQGGLGRLAPLSGGSSRLWEQRPLSADHSDTQWPEAAAQKQPTAQSTEETSRVADRRPVSTGDLDLNGLMFLSDLCSSLGDPQAGPLIPPLSDLTSSSYIRPQLDTRFCSDLVSRRTKEVYPYPSPLHAVALQSPLFTSSQDPSPPPRLSPSSDGTQPGEQPSPSHPALVLEPPQPPPSPSLTQLEQYIARLAHQYQSRVACNLTPAATPGPGGQRVPRTPRHGSTQSLSAFENRCTPSSHPGGSITPCKSLLGNSGRVSLSNIGRKASRNSINLGHLPSVTGEDLNISLHLNLNLNLNPALNTKPGLDPKHSREGSGSVGALKGDFVTPTASSSSLSTSTPTPAMRPRPRISTCPSSLSHRSSLEVTGSGAGAGMGSLAFSRSLDWSSASPRPMSVPSSSCGLGSSPGLASEPSTKLCEDSAMVAEISRLSGLPRAVVIGLMEQGVELDVDCFQSDADRKGPGLEVTGVKAPGSYSRLVGQTEPSQYPSLHLHATTGGDTDLNPPRPIQLSLSVSHSPQSHSGLTPPLAHSPQSHPSLTPPRSLSHSPQSHSSSPHHPYQSTPTHTHHTSHSFSSHYQHHAPSDPPSSSTASSPGSRPNRVRSPPRPLQPSPLGPTPLSVFRRDAPFQCSLPRVTAGDSPVGGGLRPRGGSLRQAGGGGAGGGVGGGWRRVEGEGLYQGKHVSRELVRASTVSSFARQESYGSSWGRSDEGAAKMPKRTARFCKGFEGYFMGKEEEEEMTDEGVWRRDDEGSRRKDYQKVKARPKESSWIKKKGKGGWDKRSSSLRLSRRALFRSESQGRLEPQSQREEPFQGAQWASSLDVTMGGLDFSVEGGRGRELGGRKREDKRLSSTASLYHLSRSQSLEGSCHSLSPPLSSPSFSPSPPPRAPLTRSRSLRDLGRRVFGSVRSLSLKHKTQKK